MTLRLADTVLVPGAGRRGAGPARRHTLVNYRAARPPRAPDARYKVQFIDILYLYYY